MLTRPAAAQAQAQVFAPSPELVAAARKERRCVMYTASFTEPEQEWIGEFNKRFPFVRVELVRASGGQLITRSGRRPRPVSWSPKSWTTPIAR